MTYQPSILHKTCTINVISYLLAEGGWIPKAMVNQSTGTQEKGHPVTGDSNHPLPTKDAADAIAKKLAIEWIDSQFPSASN